MDNSSVTAAEHSPVSPYLVSAAKLSQGVSGANVVVRETDTIGLTSALRRRFGYATNTRFLAESGRQPNIEGNSEALGRKLDGRLWTCGTALNTHETWRALMTI